MPNFVPTGLHHHIPMTGAVSTIGFGFRVERSAGVVRAVASFNNSQTQNLSRQLRFALLDEQLPKLGGE